MSRRVKQPAVATGNKEDILFRDALQQYESKHYKKSIKNCDLILKKSSSHNTSETLALKALNLYFLKEHTESEQNVTLALRKNEYGPVTNHILGILRRSQLRYKEAAVYFKKALDNGSTNQQIWRDLSVMEVQNRDYKNLAKSRHAYLEGFLGYRANWTSLATAHHLNKDYDAGERTLNKFEDLVKGKLSEPELYEHSELELYKNQLIYESGDVERALKELNELNTFDKLAEIEARGKYLLKLGEFEKASKVFRILLKRNPDNIKYYNFLETSLKTLDKSEKFRDQLYSKLGKFYPKSDAPKYIPLFFTTGDLFKERVSTYLLQQLQRGVPATFANIKPLYKSQPSKIPIIEKIVLEFYESTTKKDPLVYIWTTYFLVQHYLFLKNLTKANELIDIAIKHTPTLVELYILKARVLKHLNKPIEASEVINSGRLIDLQDRFINTKTVKYYLRANDLSKALETVSIFTKNDEVTKNGLKDLHTMQVNWFLIENAESYLRQYQEALKTFRSQSEDETNGETTPAVTSEDIVKLGGLTLKRFKAITKVFEEFYNDQLDFHTYSMRRGTARAYIEMIHWEDKVFQSPVYLRAARGVAQILLDTERLDVEEKGFSKDKKDKKERANRLKLLEKEKLELLAYDDDEDVFGKTLYNSEDWNKLFLDEYFQVLLNQGDELITTNELNFLLNFQLSKVPIAVSALTKLKTITDFKYPLIVYYLLKIKFSEKNSTGLNKMLLEKLLTKNFEQFKFDNIDNEIKERLNLKSFEGVLSLTKIVNLALEQLDNESYKKSILENAKSLEPFEEQVILRVLQ